MKEAGQNRWWSVAYLSKCYAGNAEPCTALPFPSLSAEEPFLIMADHHEIRKLSVDGSNYTILKQVRAREWILQTTDVVTRVGWCVNAAQYQCGTFYFFLQ